jgi:hypothetical protein
LANLGDEQGFSSKSLFISSFCLRICGAPVLRLGVKNKKEEQT